MDLPSWIRRSFSRSSRKTQQNPDPGKQSNLSKLQQSIKEEEDNESLGVTEQLIDRVKSFTIDTFKNFSLQDDEIATNSYEDGSTATSSSANVRKDLSEWQERHAVLVLSKSKELSHLRFKLCPGHMKERRFWRIYFKLVRVHVAEYELRAVQRAKIRRMAMEDEKASDAGGYEVEMAETRTSANLGATTP